MLSKRFAKMWLRSHLTPLPAARLTASQCASSCQLRAVLGALARHVPWEKGPTNRAMHGAYSPAPHRCMRGELSTVREWWWLARRVPRTGWGLCGHQRGKSLQSSVRHHHPLHTGKGLLGGCTQGRAYQVLKAIAGTNMPPFKECAKHNKVPDAPSLVSLRGGDGDDACPNRRMGSWRLMPRTCD